MTLRFHVEVFLPDELRAALRAMNFSRLQYTPHSLRAAVDDCLQSHELPLSLVLSDWSLVTVETEYDQLSSALLRRPMLTRPGWDLCLAVNVPSGRVRTVWLNRSSDRHRTLDRNKYVPAP